MSDAERKAKLYDAMRSFITAPKPEGFTVTDCAVVTCILSSGFEPLRIAHLTIARMIGCDSTTVQRSLARLVKAGLIVKHSGKRQIRANTYTVQFDRLPVPESVKRAVISEEAYKLADAYMLCLRQHHGKVTAKKSGRTYDRKFPRGWRNRWAFVLQKHLTAGNSPEYLRNMIELASQNLTKEFVRGPQAWSRRIPKPKVVTS